MALASYSDLKAAIADWLNRTDLDSVIPDFIRLAEAEFRRRLRIQDQILRVTDVVSTQYLPLPADWLEGKQICHTDARLTPLEYRSFDEILEYRRQNPTAGRPLWWSVVGEELMFVPFPDLAYELEFVYYRTIPELSDANPTNWLLEKHPDLYLYGALTQSAPYLKDDERLPVWQVKLNGLYSDLRVADDRAKTGAAPVAKVRVLGV